MPSVAAHYYSRSVSSVRSVFRSSEAVLILLAVAIGLSAGAVTILLTSLGMHLRPQLMIVGITDTILSPVLLYYAFEASRRLGLVTLGFSGGDGGAMPALCDHLFLAPSRQTAIVQQIHITAAHIVCGLVDLPVVGVPLPLMSYGGTSVLCSLMSLGLLVSVRMRQFQ